MKNRKNLKILLVVLFLLLFSLGGWLATGYFHKSKASATTKFNGDQAYQDLKYQVALGNRAPGTPGHDAIVSWMKDQLEKAGWQTEIQESQQLGHVVQNVVAKRGEGTPWIVLGAHYDTRMWANRDPDPSKRRQYVPGADDGASGVAVLIELARVLPKNLPGQVWLVMFDAEDNGEIPGWDWSLGARAFVGSLQSKPDAAIIVDMVGDSNLNIYLEKNSNAMIMAEIWGTAATLGYTQFKPVPKYAMIDDHTPFLQNGIPAVDIIDFDYPYWHTTSDTVDKTSGTSLEAVGETLRVWLIKRLSG